MPARVTSRKASAFARQAARPSRHRPARLPATAPITSPMTPVPRSPSVTGTALPPIPWARLATAIDEKSLVRTAQFESAELNPPPNWAIAIRAM